jgi:SAM-dependent methyltransferase
MERRGEIPVEAWLSLPGPVPPDLPRCPPSALIHRVVPPSEVGSIDSERRWFHDSGWLTVQELERAVALHGRRLGDFDRILDLGCGPGRVMRHLGFLADRCELHGADVRPEVIAWCSEQISFAKFRVTRDESPLPYASDSFDLVFTHFDQHYQDDEQHRDDQRLVDEVQRLLAPSGVALLAVHGRAIGDVQSKAVVPGGEKDAGDSQPRSWKGFTRHQSWPL